MDPFSSRSLYQGHRGFVSQERAAQYAAAARLSGVSSGIMQQSGMVLPSQHASSSLQRVSGDALSPAFHEQRRLSHLNIGSPQGTVLPDPSQFGMSPLQHLSQETLHPSQQLLAPDPLPSYMMCSTANNKLLEQHFRSSHQSMAPSLYHKHQELKHAVGRLSEQKNAQVFSRHQVLLDEQRHSPQKHSNMLSPTGFNSPVFGLPAFNLDQQASSRVPSVDVPQQSSLIRMESFNDTKPLTHKNEAQHIVPMVETKFHQLLSVAARQRKPEAVSHHGVFAHQKPASPVAHPVARASFSPAVSATTKASMSHRVPVLASPTASMSHIAPVLASKTTSVSHSAPVGSTTNSVSHSAPVLASMTTSVTPILTLTTTSMSHNAPVAPTITSVLHRASVFASTTTSALHNAPVLASMTTSVLHNSPVLASTTTSVLHDAPVLASATPSVSYSAPVLASVATSTSHNATVLPSVATTVCDSLNIMLPMAQDLNNTNSASVSEPAVVAEEKSGSSSSSDSDSDGSGSSSSGSHSGKSSRHSGEQSSSSSISSHSESESSESDVNQEKVAAGIKKKSKGRRSSGSARSNSVSQQSVVPFWEECPDIYGIRRSGRQRKFPERLDVELQNDKSLVTGIKRRESDADWADSIEEFSGSDDDFNPELGNEPRGKVKKHLSHRDHDDDLLEPWMADSPVSGDALRASYRQASANVNYKEEEDGETDPEEVIEAAGWADPSEDDPNRNVIEKVLEGRLGRHGDTGDNTTMYALRLPEADLPVDPDCEPTEKHYQIKWKGWSHIHNTWESESGLTQQNAGGMKKLENYKKRLLDIENWKQRADPEDVEFFECQQEMREELRNKYLEVERVIAYRTGDDGKGQPTFDYFIKWKGLPYSECTWEVADLISQYHQSEIDAYLNRDRSDKTPNRNAKVLRNRPRFHLLREQPAFLASTNDSLALRDYQLDGLNWLLHSWCKRNSVILADEMGLGKTIQAVSFLSCLHHNHGLYGPFLLVVPLSTLPTWQREFDRWAPELNVVVYVGDVNSRELIKQYELFHPGKSGPRGKLKVNALLTTYEILLKDKVFLSNVSWAVLVVDEAHRLKNDDSLLYRSLTDFHTNSRLLITGTPLQNSLKELWSLLYFIMPQIFHTWEDFEQEHSTYLQGDSRTLTALHRQLQPFLLRRVKKDVERSLPAKVERIIHVEMAIIQKEYYRYILTRNFAALTKGLKGSVSSFNNIMVELKKCCNHAHLVRPVASPTDLHERLHDLLRGSGKLAVLDKLLIRLRETGHRVLIFSQMVRMLDILAEYLQFRRLPFQRLDGNVHGELRKQAMEHFNADGSQDFCFLLSTRAGGLGINLATADTVIIFDSDWNPQNDLQAQARAHRIGQLRQVNVYRLVTRNSIEETILERAKKKMVLDHLVIQRMDTTGRTVLSKSAAPTNTPFSKEELVAILKFGAEELFKEGGDSEQDRKAHEMDIDEILSRAEDQQTQADQSLSLEQELLSKFKFASFAMDEEPPAPSPRESPVKRRESISTPKTSLPEKSWEQIIPEGELRKVEEVEEQRARLELFMGPRRKKQVNYADGMASGEKNEKSGETSQQTGVVRGKGKRGGKVKASKPGGKPCGFSDTEVRSFVKSYKKFAHPLDQLEKIAADAGLQSKSSTEFAHMASMLHNRCIQAEADKEIEPEKEGKKKGGAILQIGGVAVNASAVVKREQELDALFDSLPDTVEARRKYRLAASVKNAQWGITWTAKDDAMLLVGVYEHGFGNWEAIKLDQSLGLSKKILPAADGKPQLKHLQTRAEYLLKVVKSVVEMVKKDHGKKVPKLRIKLERPATAARPPVRKRSGKRESTQIANDMQDSEDKLEDEIVENKPQRTAGGRKLRTKAADRSRLRHNASVPKSKKKDTIPVPDQPLEAPLKVEKKDTVALPAKTRLKGCTISTSKHQFRARMSAGVAREPLAEAEASHAEISDSVASGGTNSSSAQAVKMSEKDFQRCKERLRLVKGSIRNLGKPRDDLSEKEQLELTEKCLLKIGDHINKSISEHQSKTEVLKEWRGKLWRFVAQFTIWEAEMLFSLYKKAVKKRSAAPEPDSHSELRNSSHTKSPVAGKERSPLKLSTTYRTPPRKRHIAAADRDLFENMAKKAKH